MSVNGSVKEGWDFITKIMGSDTAVQIGTDYADYFTKVTAAIDQFSKDMNQKKGTDESPDTLKGFIAEYWHADTFNVNAALKNSNNSAKIEGSNKFASADVSTSFGENYSMKYYSSGADSADQQAKNIFKTYQEYRRKSTKKTPWSFDNYLEKKGYDENPNIKKLIADYRNYLIQNKEEQISLQQFIKLQNNSYDIESLLTSVYAGQWRIIPTEQLPDAIERLNNLIKIESGKEGGNRAAVLASYKETLEKLADRISDGKGVSSVPLTKDEAETIAALCKDGVFDPNDFGFSLNRLVSSEYITSQSLQAGYTAAVITLVMQLTPELFKAFDYLIKNGDIDLKQISTIGKNTFSSTVEGFLRGSISAAITISCHAGKLGQAFVSVSPHLVGAVTVIALDTVKSSLMVAVGKMSAKEMGAQLADELIVSFAALSGGSLAQMLLPELPVLGYMLGSLLGSVIASVSIRACKKFVISYCVDTGFTCFGLVEQDYKLPDDVLESMGINIIPVPRIEIKRNQINRTSVERIPILHIKYETVKLTILRRGVIGVNKVQYIR